MPNGYRETGRETGRVHRQRHMPNGYRYTVSEETVSAQIDRQRDRQRDR